MAMRVFKNDSSSDIDPFSIINLTGVEVQGDGRYWLTADQCDNAANFLLAVTGKEKVSSGKYGLCQPVGEIVIAKYDTADGTPANEESWGPDNATFKLKKNFGGGMYAVIGADSTNEVAVLMHTGKVILKGKTSASHAATTSQNVEIWAGAVGSEADTGDTVSAYNRGDAIDNDIWVNIERTGSGWECYPLECNA